MDNLREQRQKITVLVVEDDAMVRQVSVGLLTLLGYRTLEAEDGKSALALLEAADSVNVLLTDVMMPGGMSGFQLADTVRRIQPAVKLIFTSGYNEAIPPPSLTEASPARILRKPFELSDLVAAMEDALRQG
jgi:two-component system CheB/CheR fusion protein